MSENTVVPYYDHVKDYVISDYFNPKYSTQAFSSFLQRNGCFKSSDDELVVDMGTGGGSGLAYFAKSFPGTDFLGIDYNLELVEWINNVFFLENPGCCPENMSVAYGDWTRPLDIIENCNKNITGVISVHSLCTQKNFSDAASYLVELEPEWIAFNSLFYDGPLDVLIHIRDKESDMNDDNPDADFNIHSLPCAADFMQSKGYSLRSVEPFDIGLPLPRPGGGKRGTYTVKTDWSDYSQFSGPVYLPWQFLLFEKIK